MRIIPDVNLLRSLRESGRIDHVLLAGEGIDNALDAGAKQVRITITDNEIRFRDDGAGITKDRLASIFTLGLHGAMSSSRLGRFGVGIKVQALRTGDLFEISTISRDGRMQAGVSWRDLLRSQSWEIKDPRWLPVPVGAPTGTEIKISELREAPKVASEQLRTQIAMRFHPALVDGVRIFYNELPIEPLPEPEMCEVIERQLQLSDGRSAHLRAGMLLAPSPLNRVHVGFRHRIIMPGVGIGCGTYSGLNNIFARLQIAGSWHIGQFKDDLPDESQRQELEETVHELLKPLLVRCQSASIEARIERVQTELNDLVPIELAARPQRVKTGPPAGNLKRKRRTEPGEVEAVKSEPASGPARSKRYPARLLITFDGDLQMVGIGECDLGSRPHRVNLSKDHPDIKGLIEQRDHKAGLRSLLMLAMTLYCAQISIRNASGSAPEFPDLDGAIGLQIARFLASQDLESGTTIKMRSARKG